MTRRDAILAKILPRIRLADHPDMPTPCWLWTGPTSGSAYKPHEAPKKGRGHGYPRMSLDGQTVAVHLVVYTHFNGFIPGKKQVDHVCKTRLCVNPEHLELVTHLRNQKRRATAARQKKGTPT
jgi:hypothetical protein